MTTSYIIDKPNTIVLIATGGTIAGSGSEGLISGYKSGTLSIDDIVSTIPELSELSPIYPIQFCNINSDDIISSQWIELTKLINSLAINPNVSGFVITHGTDTMEETAYFLHLTITTNKPVVLTGSMRPATALSPDGPLNLLNAVKIARSPLSKDKGVLITFASYIFSARDIQKINCNDVMAINTTNAGALGFISDDNIVFNHNTLKRHTVYSDFNTINYSSLPMVSIAYFFVDSDPSIIDYMAKNSNGIVIAGAGSGEYSLSFLETIKKLTIPVIISSRINNGYVFPNSLLCDSTIAAGDLPPCKAAILLRLCLAQNLNHEEIKIAFSEY